MKKAFLFLTVIFFVWMGSFYWKNLRGVKPAVGPIPIIEPSKPEPQNTTGLPLTLPEGFSISIFAKDLDGPRVLTWDPAGTLLASIPSQGKVVALPDKNQDGAVDEVVTILEGLNRPHGLAFFDNRLFVAQTDEVVRYDYDANARKAFGPHKLFNLPDGGNHVTRTIGFGPDKKLYTSVGSSCNVCEEKDWQRAKILVSAVDGTDLKIFASGLRNSVFFTWRGNDMWATDMGRDLIGDNIPPEEVNIIKEGKNYGWPYCWGNRVHDDSFDQKGEFIEVCKTTESPHITFQAHSAPLGLTFIPESWGKEYAGDLLVAYHGSWNRSVPTGYKIARFDLDSGNTESDFIAGWLQGDGALGRPVDLLFDSQGNLYVSDDKAGVIYRVVMS